jgi:hypothetical protein
MFVKYDEVECEKDVCKYEENEKPVLVHRLTEGVTHAESDRSND